MGILPDITITDERRAQLLAHPTERVRVVLDTDTANEIDDQYALTWALQSADRLEIEAVLAEPYSFEHLREGLLEAADQLARDGHQGAEISQIDQFSGWAARLREIGKDPRDIEFESPAEGMQRSYDEIFRVYELVGADATDKVFRGAPRYMRNAEDPVDSDAVQRLIELALAPADRPLHVVAIGCVTNVASAIVLAPEIRDRIVVLWTAGFPTWSPQSNAHSLNLVQDIPAARLLYTSGVPLVYFPGYYIGAQLRVSLPDVQEWVRGRGAIGDYLYHLYTNNPLHAQRGVQDHFGRTWVMWDMVTLAWLIEPSWVPTTLVPTPTLNDDLKWVEKPGSKYLMREAYEIERDSIFRDFFHKLDRGAQ